MAKHKNKIATANLSDSTGPHAVVGIAIRKARLESGMTAEMLVEFVGDQALTKTLISSYEAGRYLPRMDRLARIMMALRSKVTDEIKAHYAAVMEDSPHMGQVLPGGRTRVAGAKIIIAAWQTAVSAQAAADAVGISKASLMQKVSNLRTRGVPLKRMSISRSEYESLAEFASSFVFDQPEE